MIVLASDYVGFKIVEYLVSLREQILLLVLDSNDKGGYNKHIEKVYRSYDKQGVIITEKELKDDKILDYIEAKKLDFGLLAWWPYILKERILTIPHFGWLNFHPSYLPYNRGKHPNFWCLVEGTPCGISLHFIDEGVDSGEIVAQKKIDVGWEDTGETVYGKSREAIINLFKENYMDIKSNRLPRIKQSRNSGTFHKAKEIDITSQIDLDSNYSARDLLNIMRARMFPPHPTAYFYENGKKYSIEIIIKQIKGDQHD